MKKCISTCLLFLFPFTILHAQDENKVFEKVEINAHTNEKAWAEHIAKKSQLPDSVMKDIPAGTYKVNVQFVVDVHGNLGQIKAKTDPGYGLAKLATNVISTYNGKWQPANQCGRNVKAYREQVIVFVVPSQYLTRYSIYLLTAFFIWEIQKLRQHEIQNLLVSRPVLQLVSLAPMITRPSANLI